MPTSAWRQSRASASWNGCSLRTRRRCASSCDPSPTPYFEYRLWRSDPRIRFRGVMHERVVDAIKMVAVQDRTPIGNWPELILNHVGYDTDQRAKHRRNLPLLQEQLRREPGNIYNWRHLGQVLRALGREAEADEALARAVELARLQDPSSGDGSLARGELVRWRHDRGDDVGDLLTEGRERWPEQWLLVWTEGHVHLDAESPRACGAVLPCAIGGGGGGASCARCRL